MFLTFVLHIAACTGIFRHNTNLGTKRWFFLKTSVCLSWKRRCVIGHVYWFSSCGHFKSQYISTSVHRQLLQLIELRTTKSYESVNSEFVPVSDAHASYISSWILKYLIHSSSRRMLSYLSFWGVSGRFAGTRLYVVRNQRHWHAIGYRR